MKRHYTIILVALAFSLGISAQDVIYGPEYEPPMGLFTESNGTPGDNLIGTTTGKIFTFSSIDLLNYTSVYYGPVSDSVKLSLDGGDFASGDTTVQEILQFREDLSDRSQGTIVYTGSTEIPDQPGVPVYTKFVMTYTMSDTPMSLAKPDTLGLDPYLGGVPILSPGASFSVKLQFMATFDTVTGYLPHIPFYDDNSVTDGQAYSSYGWGWYWVNTAPAMDVNLAMPVNEGDTVMISKQFVRALDVESDSSQLTFMLVDEALPGNGAVYLGDAMLSAGQTFTQEDIEKEMLEYVHDGSETTSDLIALRLMDGDNKYYVVGEDTTFYLSLIVTPVDDDPVVETNTALMLNEGDEETVTGAYLLTTDSESDASKVTYTVDPDSENTWPKYGLLRKSDVPVESGGTFTQEDIENGLITYTHDGTENVQDGFVFKVTDEFGHPAQNEGSELFFFEIDVTLTNDPPIFTKNVSSDMIEWDELVIGANQIAASDEESPNSEIYFTLVSENLPVFGQMEVDGEVVNTGEAFTMQDVIDNKLQYVQTMNATEPVDKFVFQITDGDGAMAMDGTFTDFQHVINITLTSTTDQVPEVISVYPNPGNGRFNINGSSDLEAVTVLDITGKRVYSANGEALAVGMIDLTDEPSGVYMLKAIFRSGSVKTSRLVIE